MNDSSVMGVRSGALCSCHVSPRSADRNNREFATSAQTTLADGALSCATFGSGMSVADAAGAVVAVGAGVVAAAVGVGVDVGVGLAAATVGDALGTAAGEPHAARARTNGSAISRFMPIVSPA
jgi:hypothetical protein